MNIQYYFRHIGSSDALKAQIAERVATLEPLILSSTPVHVTFSVANNLQTVHIGLHARGNSQIEVEESSEDMYKSIDMAFDTLSRAVTREKEKQTHHHLKLDPFEMSLKASVAVNKEREDSEAIDAEKVLEQYASTGH